MYGYERSLVAKHADEPFALIGVNSDDSLETVRRAIKRNELNWRSFYDGKSGPIARSWAIRGWPSIFLIDHAGKVRYTKVREKSELDEAIDKLLVEARKQ